MSSRPSRLTCLVPGLLAALLWSGADDPEAFALEAVDRLADAVTARDAEGVREALVDLDSAWPRLSAKAAGKALKGVGRLFSKYKPRDEIREDGSTDAEEIRECYRMAIGLVFDKDGGDDVLRGAFKVGHIKTWPQVQANLLEGLGHRRDPGQLDFVAGYLKHDAHEVVVAAAVALGRLDEADVAVRREAAGALVSAYERLAKAAAKEARKARDDEEEGPARTALARCEYPLNDALRALTRQRFESAEDWSDWLGSDGRRDGW